MSDRERGQGVIFAHVGWGVRCGQCLVCGEGRHPCCTVVIVNELRWWRGGGGGGSSNVYDYEPNLLQTKPLMWDRFKK